MHLVNSVVRMIRLEAILSVAMAGLCVPTAALGQAGGVLENNTWKVFQRPYGCGISKSGKGDLSPEPVFWRPLRGEIKILLSFVAPQNRLLSTGNLAGFLKLSSDATIPVDVNISSELDVQRWTSKRLLSVKLKNGSEERFRKALSLSQRAQIKTKDETLDIALPSLGTWQQTDECLKSVGEALIASAPPPYRDGTLPNRKIPVLREGSWIDANAYPLEALEHKAEGDVQITANVDQYGYPLGCKILKSSGSKILDDATCQRLIERAHFYPALDSAGLATNGNWQVTIKWRLP